MVEAQTREHDSSLDFLSTQHASRTELALCFLHLALKNLRILQTRGKVRQATADDRYGIQAEGYQRPERQL